MFLHLIRFQDIDVVLNGALRHIRLVNFTQCFVALINEVVDGVFPISVPEAFVQDLIPQHYLFIYWHIFVSVNYRGPFLSHL